LHNNYFLKHAAKIIKKYQLYNDINKKYPEKYFFSTILIRYKSMLLNFGLNCWENTGTDCKSAPAKSGKSFS